MSHLLRNRNTPTETSVMIGINYFLGYPTTRTSNTKNIGKILGKLYSSSKIALPIATSETGAHYDSPFCIRLHTVDRGASEFLKFNGLSHSMVGLVPVEVEVLTLTR